MKDRGYDYTRGRRKYYCPLVVKGVVTCDTPYSDSPYGRCVHTYTKHNPRLFPPVARNSNEWNDVYKRRTTCERSHKRAKEDFLLEAAKHRSTMMWTVRIYGIAMCQHMDAWTKESTLDLRFVTLVSLNHIILSDDLFKKGSLSPCLLYPFSRNMATSTAAHKISSEFSEDIPLISAFLLFNTERLFQ